MDEPDWYCAEVIPRRIEIDVVVETALSSTTGTCTFTSLPGTVLPGSSPGTDGPHGRSEVPWTGPSALGTGTDRRRSTADQCQSPPICRKAAEQ